MSIIRAREKFGLTWCFATSQSGGWQRNGRRLSFVGISVHSGLRFRFGDYQIVISTRRVLEKAVAAQRLLRALESQEQAAPPPDTGRDTLTPRDTGGGDG